MASESPARPLTLVGLAALALVSLPLSRTPEPGVSVERAVLRSPRGDEVPVLLVSPRAPRGTALLAHGITASKETLRYHAEGLALAGLRCVVLDLPAHGESTQRLRMECIQDAYAAGALALAGEGRRVDVLVGHSFGAYNGARALSGEVLEARLFVAIGACPSVAPPGDPRRPERVLYLSGGLEEIHSPAEVRAHAENQGAAAQIIPGVTHASEILDPRIVRATVDAATSLLGVEPAPPAIAWRARFLGFGALMGCALAGLAFLPRHRAVSGLLAGGLIVGAAVSAAHGVILYLAPTPERLLLGGLLSALAAGASAGLCWLTRRAQPDLRPLTGQLVALGLALCVLISAALMRHWFGFLVLLLLGALLAVSTGVAWLVDRRTGSAAASHLTYGLVAGYVPGAWFGSLML